MKICYFVNQYPKVSHSFIRREILALESLGAQVTRVAARNNPAELVDSADLKELDNTLCIATRDKKQLLTSGLKVLKEKPFTFLKALKSAFVLGFYDNSRYVSQFIYLLEASRLLKICEEKEIQHLHAHFGTNSTSVVMLCRLLGGPKYSFTVHGPEEFDKPIQISLGRKIQNADFVVAITSYCRSQLYRWSRFQDWNKIKEVHCAVDSAITEKPLEAIPSPKAFVSIGRLCEQKGQLLLIHALAKLNKKSIDFHLTLIGDGEMRDELEQLVKTEGLQEKVHFAGWQSSAQIVDTLDKSSALLLPSFAEGLPVVIMEAYARSRPVLSTYIAGIPELVDEDSGWLVPAGNIDALCDKIEEIINTPSETLQALGDCGRNKVLERHEIMIESEKLLNLMKAP